MVGVICLLAITVCFDDDKKVLPKTPDEVAARLPAEEPDDSWLAETLRLHPEFVDASVSESKLTWIAIRCNKRNFIDALIDAGATIDPPVAAYIGDQAWLEKHFASGAEYIEHFQIDGFPLGSESLLHVAARGGQVRVIEYLLKAGGARFREALEDDNIVWRAAGAGSEEAVDVLLNARATGIERAAMWLAWEGKDIPMLAHLIEKAPRLPKHRFPLLDFALSRSWPAGTTLLTHAAEYGNLGAVELLLAKGADAKVKDADGRSALDYVRGRGGDRIAKRLRQAGAPAQPATVVRHGELAEIETLIRQGKLKVNTPAPVRGEDLVMPLRIALDSGRPEVIQLLVRRGADPFLPFENHGSVINTIGLWYERGRLAALLSAIDAKGLDKLRKWRDEHTGGTLLHEQAEDGNIAAIRMLLKAGIDKTVKNKDGKTAADLACNEVVRKDLR